MRFVSAFVLALATAVGLSAQTIRGTITGTVADSTGGVVPGATVVATNTAAGIAGTGVSNQQGWTYDVRSMQHGSSLARRLTEGGSAASRTITAAIRSTSGSRARS